VLGARRQSRCAPRIRCGGCDAAAGLL